MPVAFRQRCASAPVSDAVGRRTEPEKGAAEPRRQAGERAVRLPAWPVKPFAAAHGVRGGIEPGRFRPPLRRDGRAAYCGAGFCDEFERHGCKVLGVP